MKVCCEKRRKRGRNPDGKTARKKIKKVERAGGGGEEVLSTIDERRKGSCFCGVLCCRRDLFAIGVFIKMKICVYMEMRGKKREEREMGRGWLGFGERERERECFFFFALVCLLVWVALTV